MKRHYIILLLLLILGSHSQAQVDVIVGEITDKNTGKPIQNVNVYWKSYDDDTEAEKTDHFGVYSIENSSTEDVLIFEQSGFSKQEIPYSRIVNKELDVEMVPFSTSITASRWETSVNESPASIVVITREEIARYGYTTIQEILENVPGMFTIDHRSESDMTIGIRGLWAPFNRNVMIQLNGVNMLNERQNDFPMNKINVAVESIDKIEIVRGPMSVMYGAGAFFGVINIITNTADYGVSGTASSGIGTQNGQKNFIRYAVNQNGLKLTLNGMTYRSFGFEQLWDDMVSEEMYAIDDTTEHDGYPNATTISDYQHDTIKGERYSRYHQSINFSAEYKGFFSNINYAASDFGFSFLHPGPADRNPYVSKTGNYQFGYRWNDIKIGNTSQKKNPFELTSDKNYSNRLYAGILNLEAKGSFMKSDVDVLYRFFSDTVHTTGRDEVSSLRNEINGNFTIIDGYAKKSKADSNKNYLIDLDLLFGVSFMRNLENGSYYNQPEQNLRNWYVGLHPDSDLDTWAGYSQLNSKIEFPNRSTLQIIAGGRLEQQKPYVMLSDRNPDYFFTNPDTNFLVDESIDYDTSQDYFYEIEEDTFSINHQYVTDTNHIDSVYFIPRAALIYTFPQNEHTSHVFKAMMGRAIKQGTVVDNANDIMIVDTNDVKSYLSPERIFTYEFGYTFENNNFLNGNNGVSANLNYFHNELRSLITRVNYIDSQGEYSAISANDGSFASDGVELIFSHRLNKKRKNGFGYFNLVTTASGTFQNTRYKSDNETEDTVSFSPSKLGTFAINGRLPISKSFAFSFGINLNYVGSMKPFYSPSGENPGEYIGADSDDYYRLGANIRINWSHTFKKHVGNLYLNARISNLNNAKYFYPTYTINPWADKGVLGRGRSLMFTLGYTISDR